MELKYCVSNSWKIILPNNNWPNKHCIPTFGNISSFICTFHSYNGLFHKCTIYFKYIYVHHQHSIQEFIKYSTALVFHSKFHSGMQTDCNVFRATCCKSKNKNNNSAQYGNKSFYCYKYYIVAFEVIYNSHIIFHIEYFPRSYIRLCRRRELWGVQFQKQQHIFFKKLSLKIYWYNRFC